MAINFPSSPANGEEYTDAGSGTEWVYNSADKSWTMTGAGSSSPFNFRGGYDFTTNNTIGAVESGDLFIHEGADGTVGSGYAGLSGQITTGTLVLWDGNEFIRLSSSVPGYPDIDDPGYQNGTLDDRYLSLAADAGDQTVASSGTTTFDGLVEAGNGVKLTGGRQTQVENGLIFTADADGANPKLRIIQNNANKLQFNDASTTSLQPLTINPEAGRGQALSFNAPNTTESLQDGGSYCTFQADQTGATFDGKFSFLRVSLPAGQADAVVACSDIAGVRIDNAFVNLTLQVMEIVLQA